MRRSSLFWGSVLVFIGVVLLLDNLGYLGGLDAWGLIYPIFLIGLGVYILLRIIFHRSPECVDVSIPLEGATRALVKVRHGAGKLAISGGAGTANIIEGSFGGGLQYKSKMEEGVLQAKLSMPDQDFPFWSWQSNLDWQIRLNPEVALRLDLKTGAGQGELDLSDLQLEEITLGTGASSINVTMPSRVGYTRMKVDAGAASLHIRIPDGVAGLIRARGGLTSIRVDSGRFPRDGDGYRSPNYNEAAHKIEIEISAGVGTISVS